MPKQRWREDEDTKLLYYKNENLKGSLNPVLLLHELEQIIDDQLCSRFMGGLL